MRSPKIPGGAAHVPGIVPGIYRVWTGTSGIVRERLCLETPHIASTLISSGTGREQFLAEGEGFEPSIRFPVYTLSKRAPSAARPPLRHPQDVGSARTIVKIARLTTRGRVGSDAKGRPSVTNPRSQDQIGHAGEQKCGARPSDKHNQTWLGLVGDCRGLRSRSIRGVRVCPACERLAWPRPRVVPWGGWDRRSGPDNLSRSSAERVASGSLPT